MVPRIRIGVPAGVPAGGAWAKAGAVSAATRIRAKSDVERMIAASPAGISLLATRQRWRGCRPRASHISVTGRWRPPKAGAKLGELPDRQKDAAPCTPLRP